MFELDERLIGRSVLVVEDQFYLAQEITRAFAAAGARPVGPAPTVAKAIDHVAHADLDLAILDINLAGELAFAVADSLAARSVPFLFSTAYSQIPIPDRHREVPLLAKPLSSVAIVRSAAGLLPERSKALEGDASLSETTATILSMIPSLRALADAFTPDGSVADRLVSDALVEAILQASRRPDTISLDEWLLRVSHGCFAAAAERVEVKGSDSRNRLFRLPRDLREVVVLSTAIGLPPARVASIVGVPEAEAERRISAGLAMLQRRD